MPLGEDRNQAYAGAVATCSMCGEGTDSEPAPLTWMSSVENGRSRWFCDTCSRTHLRAIEGKLDSEWW